MKIFLILSVIAMFRFAYVSEDKNIIHLATSQSKALVVGAAPIAKIELDPANMEDYAANFNKFSNDQLDTTMFSQIIMNAASLDTSSWTDTEFKNLLVVKERNENISKKYLFKKLKLSGKKQMKFYSRKIKRYNSTHPTTRDIFYFSRPVYNNSGEYAIIQWNNAPGSVNRQGGIKLYQLKDKKWVDVGAISSWSY